MGCEQIAATLQRRICLCSVNESTLYDQARRFYLLQPAPAAEGHILYVGGFIFGSTCDNEPWHNFSFSINSSTLLNLYTSIYDSDDSPFDAGHFLSYHTWLHKDDYHLVSFAGRRRQPLLPSPERLQDPMVGRLVTLVRGNVG